jgi:hypothetical protein
LVDAELHEGLQVNGLSAHRHRDKFASIRVRHRTTPSFTVEIKRAKTPSVGTSTGEAVSFESDIRRKGKKLPSEDLFAGMKLPSQSSLGSETTSDAPRIKTGRILPSLTRVADPLQVREQQETDERLARQSMVRETSNKAVPSNAGEFHMTDETPAVGSAPQTGAVRETHVAASSPAEMPSSHAEEPRQKKGNAYWPAYRKAVRRGLPLPSLPAGERWKRRLPPVVW